jgi:hypothetical protein
VFNDSWGDRKWVIKVDAEGNFGIYEEGTATPRLHINYSNNNIGIGVSPSSFPFQISGGVRAPTINFINTSAQIKVGNISLHMPTNTTPQQYTLSFPDITSGPPVSTNTYEADVLVTKGNDQTVHTPMIFDGMYAKAGIRFGSVSNTLFNVYAELTTTFTLTGPWSSRTVTGNFTRIGHEVHLKLNPVLATATSSTIITFSNIPDTRFIPVSGHGVELNITVPITNNNMTYSQGVLIIFPDGRMRLWGAHFTNFISGTLCGWTNSLCATWSVA